MHKLILASASPRRQELMQNLGLTFTVDVSGADESAIPQDLPPSLYVQELAALKCASVASGYKSGLVIGADTVVLFNGQILGKPIDSADARHTLSSLSGHTHAVYTGIAVCDAATGKMVTAAECTRVTFGKLSDAEIDAYIASGEYADKAGSYGVQGRAGRFVSHIEGDFFNVVGLPVYRLKCLIRDEFEILI